MGRVGLGSLIACVIYRPRGQVCHELGGVGVVDHGHGAEVVGERIYETLDVGGVLRDRTQLEDIANCLVS